MDIEGRRGHRHAVILAGGSGVRFWPRSRASRPKQFLAPLGGETLLRRTVERICPLFPPEHIWVLTTERLRGHVRRELPEVAPAHIVAEPVQRNTCPAIGLAAALLLREDPDAVMGVFPSDHHIADETAYRDLLDRALDATALKQLIVLGIEPAWPETGYGYVEFEQRPEVAAQKPVRVARFTEKPSLEIAAEFVRSGRHFWNSGQFCWRASTFAREMQRYQSDTWEALQQIADQPADRFHASLAEGYPSCENTSVDHAVLERSRSVAGFTAPDLGWSDLGNWQALYRLLTKDEAGNALLTPSTLAEARGNLIDVPGKHVALVGVEGLVVVETSDALLICRRDASQNVGGVVDALREAGLDELL